MKESSENYRGLWFTNKTKQCTIYLTELFHLAFFMSFYTLKSQKYENQFVLLRTIRIAFQLVLYNTNILQKYYITIMKRKITRYDALY